MAKKLVIVESPAKARTVSRLLGSRYTVKASIGHVRDLPKSQLGVDVGNDFKPKYLIPRGKRKIVRELTKLAKGTSSIYLATDPDREGEAISWHLVQAAHLDNALVQRVVFHELTKKAIKDAFLHPRAIDLQLVTAQQTRRILDRLVGYKLSPLLWKKVRRGLSAGRVQSAALRIVVDREREIESFIPTEHWSIDAELITKSRPKKTKPQAFRARLAGFVGERKKLKINNEDEAKLVTADLKQATYVVAKVDKKKVLRQPTPPFTTSTLQQEAWRKLKLSAKHTMAVAQQLYEGLPIGKDGEIGLITYMRTDSTRVSPSAQREVRAYITKKFGADFVPRSPRRFTKKAKGAQEAHEAIRPTSVKREPEQLKPYLTPTQLKLYDLIWKRMVASQMSAAQLEATTVEIEAKNSRSKAQYLLRATGSVVTFQGFLTLYREGRDDGNGEAKKPLPDLFQGEPLKLLELIPEQHFTQPPPRYTEATLVKALEENGIGRPSTYAPILSAIQERGYVHKEKGRLRPWELGIVVSDLLSEHFADIVDLGFTAQMEEGLDKIACGEREWVPFLRQFYDPFDEALRQASVNIQRVKFAGEPTDEVCELCGRPMVIKQGRYGRFMSCSGFPECKNTKPILVTIGVRCPQCGGELVERRTKKKRLFYGCANYPQCDFAVWNKPLPQPCPHCGGLMTMRGEEAARCSQCGYQGKVTKTEEPVGRVTQ